LPIAFRDPQRYGVVDSQTTHALFPSRKSLKSQVNFAVAGIISTMRAPQISHRTLKPSARGELEITDLNRVYLDRDHYTRARPGARHCLVDTGTPSSTIQASTFVETIFQRQGFKIACLEEIAFSP